MPPPDETEGVQLLLLPAGMRTTLMFFPEQLSLGSVDAFLLDSFSLFHQLHVSQALRSMVRPLFPVNDEIGELAFGTSARTPELNGTLASWMEEYRTTSAYESLVRRYLGISYDRYLAFIEDFPE
jgi:ABC-type amino acid transport substrate-binding protein